ncbi:MAG TPA: acyl-CoA dehydrogenase family protein, partial [Caulobacteraceae bacterium]|nr:acyl-CoA dehydrogenase family protein [Caulobacteraceae bacterium]
WRDLNDKLGLCGVHVPEEYGGQGFGFVELGIVLEEMGRALVCAPYFASTVLATTAILNGASVAQKLALLPPLVAGERVATLAFAEPSGRWDAAGTEATATEAGGHWRVDGVKSFVLDGASADLVVVLARTPGSSGEDGLSLFAVEGDAAGLTRTPLKPLDPTRKIAKLTFESVQGQLLGEAGAAAAPFARTLAQAAACLASEMVGGAERLRESALYYARLRMQFGRPIASFQSMKHKQADMLLEVELAKSAAYTAAQAAAEDSEGAPALASLAKAAASEAYLQTAIHTIQIHGGIGFTWENDTHLWFKRAKSSEVFLGDPAWHREQMLRAWGH